MDEIYDVLIIGAGQAGISMSYQLKERGIRKCLMLDAHKQIGDAWRFRYQSLVLFTPKAYSALPGLAMTGDANAYPTKDEMADYLARYVARFNLPHKMNTVVTSIEKKHDQFMVYTTTGMYQSKNVVIASGAFQKPNIPPIVEEHEHTVSHMHASSYREPKSLNYGLTLVVGGGNSGAQIAVELSKDREVLLAVSHKLTYLPLERFGKSIFYWLEKLQLLYAGIDTRRGKVFQKRRDPIFGTELRQVIQANRVQIKPRLQQVKGKEVTFSDGSRMKVDQIIWATGYVPSYEMISIAGALDPDGKPIHKRGKSPIEGLYYIGLPWQYSRGSALVCGVGRDASDLAAKFF